MEFSSTLTLIHVINCFITKLEIMLKNQVQLIGNLGSNPEVKHLNSGKTMARMRLATNEGYTNSKGERIEDTQWHTIVAWGKTASIAEKYLKKGSEIAIKGKLSHRSYDDKEGNKRFFTEVVTNEILMLSKAPKN